MQFYYRRTRVLQVYELARSARNRILHYALIHSSGIVYPLSKPSSIDLTTQSILPVFLTSQALHREAEETLCSTAIFSSCCPQDKASIKADHCCEVQQVSQSIRSSEKRVIVYRASLVDPGPSGRLYSQLRDLYFLCDYIWNSTIHYLSTGLEGCHFR